MKRIVQLIILLGIGSFIVYSCSSSDFRGYKKTESGIHYKFYVNNTDSVNVKEGDKITFSLEYKINDSLIFETNKQSESSIVIPKSTYTGDIYDCFKLMSVGDSAAFIIEADSFFLKTVTRKTLPENIKPKSKLYAYINITDVITKEKIDFEQSKYLEERKAIEIEITKKVIAELQLNKEFIENTGIFYKEDIKGSGALPKTTDYVFLNYEVKTVDDEILFSTKTANKPKEFECGKREEETEGFNLIISQMSKGQKASFIVPSNLGLGERTLGGRLEAHTPLIYVIEVVDIQTKEKYLSKQNKGNKASIDIENQKIAAFVKKNKITEKPLESGLYYIERKEGSGPLVKKGDNVLVHYTLYNLDGTKINSSVDRGTPFAFKVGEGQVITGWDEALTLMKVGGNATLILPSKIAYGDQKRSEDILPYSPLHFEIELIGIVKK